MSQKNGLDEFNQNNRLVYMIGEIEEESVSKLIMKILHLAANDPEKDILMFISSYGGNVCDYLAVHDIMRLVPCRIATVGVGKCMSASAMLLLSGTEGLRFATPNCRLLMHQVSWEGDGTLAEMEAAGREAKKQEKLMTDIVLDHTKIKPKELIEIFSKDSYMGAADALKYGIIDCIIRKPQNLYGQLKI